MLLNNKQWLIVLGFILIVNSSFGNPNGGVVSSGSATINSSSNTVIINQNSPKAIINWKNFNIGPQEQTSFIQPKGGITLNRINPHQGASQIFGTLTATGRIILVNQAGIFFGPGSHVDVGGIIASTSDISNKNFNAGIYKFDRPSQYNGSIINQGTIHTADYGLAALVGTNVINGGLIQARFGNVILASGDKYTFDFTGDGLINFTVDAPASHAGVDQNGNTLKTGVSNSGKIMADGGTVLVTAKAAQGIVDNAINMSGEIQAKSVSQKNGVVILSGGDNGSVEVSGSINVSGHNHTKTATGGSVQILGDHIHVTSTANINASGDAGGGNVFIGGSEHGAGPLPNASTTTIDTGASIHADASISGNGGTVIVWSNNDTQFHGSISAQGGINGGNGGFTETSGHYLDIGGAQVNLSASQGVMGTWLLDPANVVINSSATSNDALNGGTYSPTSGQATSNILNTDLQTALATSSIIVTTTNTGTSGGITNASITVSSPISWSANTSLTLSAAQNIVLNANITNTAGSVSGTPLVTLQADNTGTGTGTISGSGVVTTAAGQSIAFFYNPTNYTSPTNFSSNVSGGTLTAYMLVNSLGTSTDSSTTKTLGAISNNSSLWSGNYALGTNIDASGTSSWNSGLGFKPIGNNTTKFTGNFNGQGFTINNLYINLSSNIGSDAGLFGDISSPARISNLGVTNAVVQISATQTPGQASGQVNGGILVGVASSGINITNSYTTGVISSTVGSARIGGLVGNNGGTLQNDYTLASVNLTYSGSGGFANAGGLAGVNGGTIQQSYADTPVLVVLTAASPTDSIQVGGLVGPNNSGETISNSYSLGSVTYNRGSGNNQNDASLSMGGLAGQNAGTLTNTYSTGSVIFSPNASGSNPVVGGLIGSNSGTVTNSFWDTQTSQQSSSGGSTGAAGYKGMTTAQMMTTANFTATANGFVTTTSWSIGASSGSTWYQSTGLTRPILEMEYTTTITNPHQLQLINLNLAANYTLTNNVDLSAVANPADVWGGLSSGFIPLGSRTTNFSGIFNGQNYIIYNLNITASSPSSDIGLFADTSSTALIENVGLINASVNESGGNGIDTGALVGLNAGTVSNAYSTGSVSATETNPILGGLVGLDTGTITSSYSVATVTNASSSGGTLTEVGGLAGGEGGSGNITLSYSGGSVISSLSGSLTSYYIGGLVGSLSNTLSNAYSYASVTNNYAGGYVGGLVGTSGTISNSYSTGAMTVAAGTTVGGLVGLNSGGSVTNSFWDTSTTGRSNGYGSNLGTITNLIGGCFNGTCTSGGTANLSAVATYNGTTYSGVNWSITNIAGDSNTATPPSTTWLIFNNGSRPILDMEWSTNIQNAHQLQLMGAALQASYTLGSNVDASGTTNVSDIWGSTASGAGFIPIGNTSLSFSGSLNGQGYYVNNLMINPTQSVGYSGAVSNYIGFLGNVSGSGTIQKLGLTNISVTGGNVVGGLIGNIASGTETLSQDYVTGSIVSQGTGGLGYVGVAPLIAVNAATANVSNSYSLASAQSLSGTETVAGFIGYMNAGSIIDSYSTGAVSGSGNIAGFVGFNSGGSFTSSVWDKTTSGQSSGVASGSSTNLTGLTTTQALTSSNYSGWNISTSPGAIWYMVSGSTRPILQSEYSARITNTYQLQLMNLYPSASYFVENNINASNTSTAADVWGGSLGFYPVSIFTGIFNGNNQVISSLTINTPAVSIVGLFGEVENALIENTGFTSSQVQTSGSNTYLGTIAGRDDAGSIFTNLYTSITGSLPNGGGYVGGLFGYLSFDTVTNVYNAININNNSAGDIGGLIGDAGDNVVIKNSYNAGNISSTATIDGGGLVGDAYLDTYSSATPINISNSFNYGAISVGGQAGGLVAAGGLTVSNSYNRGSITGGSYAGGLLGYLDVSTSIQNTFNASTVSATTAGAIVGQFSAGSIPGSGYSISNTYWDSTIGPVRAYGSAAGGPAGNTTAAMETSSTYVGFTIGGVGTSNTWNIAAGVDYPHLNSEGLFLVQGTIPTSGDVINLYINNALSPIRGTPVKAVTSGTSYSAVFTQNVNNAVSGSIITLYDTTSNNSELIFQSNGTSLSNVNLTANTVTAGISSINTALSNTLFTKAHGAIFSDVSSNLTLNSGISFIANNLYNLDGNITTTNGGITFSSPVTLTSSSGATLTTTTSGNITFNSTIDALASNIPQLSLVTGGSSTVSLTSTIGGTTALGNLTVNGGGTISGVISGIQALAKQGSGTLTLSNTNTFSGTITDSAGILSISADNNLGATSNALSFQGGTLQTTSTFSLAATRALQINSSGGAISANSGTTLTYAGTSLSGSGALSFTGAGTVILSSANTSFSGTTTVSNGTLEIQNSNAVNTSTITLNGLGASGSNGALVGNGTLTLSNTMTVGSNTEIGTLVNTDSLTLSGNINGANALTLAGPGNITLNGAVGNTTALTTFATSSTSGSTTTINNNITTTGAQSYNNAITSNASVTLSITGTSTGNLTIGSSGYTLNGANTLALSVGTSVGGNTNTIAINGPISATSGTLTLSAPTPSTQTLTSSSISTTSSINVANFNLLHGDWYQNTASLPTFTVSNNFQLNSGSIPNSAVQFIRATSGTGVSGSAFTITDVYGLQGIGSDATTLGGFYQLAANSVLNAASAVTWNSNAGFVPIGIAGTGFTGQFNGQNSIINNLPIYLPSNSYVGLFGNINPGALVENVGVTNVNVTGQYYAGGLAGNNGGVITNTYSTGTVTGRSSGSFTGTGGLVGDLTGGTINTSYSSATVIAVGDAGGLVGSIPTNGSALINNSYSIGSIYGSLNTSSSVGGLIGSIQSGVTITNTYSSGAVTLLNSGNVGGLIGFNGSSTINNSFWDKNTSNQSSGVGAGSSTGVTGLTTAQMMTASSFSAWGSNITNLTTNPGSTSAPATTWLIFNNGTRPLLSMEWNTTVSNAHQLQLMGAALSASYTLANNIDLTSAMNNASDIWGTNQLASSGAGFVPVGNSTNVFSGSLNGAGYTLNNLYVNAASNNYVGLIGDFSSGTIQNMSVTNATITGGALTGILVGQMNSGTVQTSYTSGTVTGTQQGSNGFGVGGLIGAVSGGTVTNTYSTATVISTNSDSVGGLVGAIVGGSISNSYSSGTENGTGNVGGLTGFGTSGISNSYWDTSTTSATGGGGTSESLSAMMTASTFSSNWNITNIATGSNTTTPPNTTWLIISGSTRPILKMEWNTNISNPHQLQLADAALQASYTLSANINASATGTNASDIWGTSATNNSAGFAPIGNSTNVFSGNLNGAGYTINNLYIKAASNNYVGLIGDFSSGTIQNIGVMNATITGGALTGILVGQMNSGIVQTSYTSGTVTGTQSGGSYGVGGLIGQVSGGTVTNTYSTANVVSTNADSIGGLVGGGGGNISNSYTSGLVTGSGNVGGFIGFLGSTTLSNDFWDKTVDTNQTNGIGSGSSSGVTAATTATLMTVGTFSGNWNITDVNSSPGTTTPPSTTWLIFNGETRPILGMEWNTTISNAHQLQLMGAAVNANYTLSNNIDASATGTTASDIWGTTANSGGGFAPIGNTSITFTGILNGAGYGINNLYINATSTTEVGLIGHFNTGTIQNIAVTNATVAGKDITGILVGQMDGGSISNSYTTGYVSGTRSGGSYGVGGLVGQIGGGTITNTYSMAVVQALGTFGNSVGGLVVVVVYSISKIGRVNPVD